MMWRLFFQFYQALLCVVLLVGLGEAVADLAWLPFYFRHGIPLYVRKVIGTLPSRRHDLMDLVSCSQTALSFHRLSPHEVAFRLSWWQLWRRSVMHGRLVWDGSDSFRIIGLANWTLVALGVFLLFALIALSPFLIHAPTGFVVFAILMLAFFVCIFAWWFDLERQDLNNLIVQISARLKPPA